MGGAKWILSIHSISHLAHEAQRGRLISRLARFEMCPLRRHKDGFETQGSQTSGDPAIYPLTKKQTNQMEVVSLPEFMNFKLFGKTI